MLLDPAVSRQRYVEDCEVCCHPIEISYILDDDGLIVAFHAEPLT